MDLNHQLEIIKRGTVDLVSEEELIDKLKRKKQLRIKLGLDPTAPDIHLGHTVVLQKLRQFQELGHKIYLIIGDFTARIGDPSGRSTLRPALSEKEIKNNAATYVKQVSKILDVKKAEIRFNSEWLGKMSVLDFAALGAKQTVARMLEREDFKKRIQEGHDITILEFYYPLMQAQDSVELKADVEVGGSDQIFNLLMGRTIQKRCGQEPQVVLTVPLLVGTDGTQKMSKSYGNYIGVSEAPNEIFGKIMSLSDELMWMYYELLSKKKMDEIKKLQHEVEKGTAHPKKVKEELAMEMVERFYSAKEAKEAKGYFEKVFSKQKMPDEIEEFSVSAPGASNEIKLVDAVMETKIFKSKSDIKRLIMQGGLMLNGEKMEDINKVIAAGATYELKLGKHKFARVKVK